MMLVPIELAKLIDKQRQEAVAALRKIIDVAERQTPFEYVKENGLELMHKDALQIGRALAGHTSYSIVITPCPHKGEGWWKLETAGRVEMVEWSDLARRLREAGILPAVESQ